MPTREWDGNESGFLLELAVQLLLLCRIDYVFMVPSYRILSYHKLFRTKGLPFLSDLPARVPTGQFLDL